MDVGRRQQGEELYECATQLWFEQAIICHQEHPSMFFLDRNIYQFHFLD
jgi:hypothetical protein